MLSTSGPLAIQTESLTKEYPIGFGGRRRFRALNGLSLTVEGGISYGFLGPNGAGKSTTIKLLMGLIFPTQGSSSVWGGSISSSGIKRRVGYSPENPAFPEHLSGLEVLQFVGGLYGLGGADLKARAATALEQLGLARAANVQTRKYYKGMVQRLSIAQAIMHGPELVILDEPMSGLDPLGRRDVKDLILNLRREGKTVFFSTHIIADVEEICDSAAILVGGEMVKAGPVHSLLGVEEREIEITYNQVAASGAPVRGTRLTRQAETRKAIEEIWASGGEVLTVQARRYGLEKVFLEEVASRPPPKSYE